VSESGGHPGGDEPEGEPLGPLRPATGGAGQEHEKTAVRERRHKRNGRDLRGASRAAHASGFCLSSALKSARPWPGVGSLISP